MGDSAVIRLWKNTQDESPLGIYLHWGGSSYATELATGIDLAKNRWDDEDYANRIVVSHLAYCFAAGDTGMGLFTGTESRGEDRWPLNVNWKDRIVWCDAWRLSFEDFAKNKDGVWEELERA